MPTKSKFARPKPSWQRNTASERKAGSQLLTHLLKLYASCRLTAQQFAVACHYCAEANVPGGNFRKYGSPEGLQSGKYQRNLDKVLPEPSHLYLIQVPGNVNHSPMRTIQSLPVKLAYEAIEDELAADPSIWTTAQANAADRSDTVMDIP
eukprot:9474341-Pyramimonas_sp.AAC.1